MFAVELIPLPSSFSLEMSREEAWERSRSSRAFPFLDQTELGWLWLVVTFQIKKNVNAHQWSSLLCFHSYRKENGVKTLKQALLSSALACNGAPGPELGCTARLPFPKRFTAKNQQIEADKPVPPLLVPQDTSWVLPGLADFFLFQFSSEATTRHGRGRYWEESVQTKGSLVCRGACEVLGRIPDYVWSVDYGPARILGRGGWALLLAQTLGHRELLLGKPRCSQGKGRCGVDERCRNEYLLQRPWSPNQAQWLCEQDCILLVRTINLLSTFLKSQVV